MDIFRGGPVNFSLGSRNKSEDGQGVILDLLGKAATADNLADLPEAAVMVFVAMAPLLFPIDVFVFVAFSMAVVMVFISMGVTLLMSVWMFVTVAVAVVVIVLMGMTMLVIVIVAMAVIMTFGMFMPMAVMMFVPMGVMVIIKRINVMAGFVVYYVELCPHESALAHLPGPDAEAFKAQRSYMAADFLDVGAGVDECPNEHVAADTGRCIKIEDPFHCSFSFSLIPMAILFIMSAW
jgi:hypothetical protein